MSTDEVAPTMPSDAVAPMEEMSGAGGGEKPETSSTAPVGADCKPPDGEGTSEQQTEEQLSALRDNLARKGKNSYYYAHNRVMDIPSWDGRQAPRRLATGDPVPQSKRAEKVTNYAWANEKSKVRIYVPLEGCGSIDDDAISLKWESRCVDLEVCLPSGSRRLHIPSLHDEITGATLRKKQDKVVIALTKKDEVTWYDLTTSR